ncbi:methyltransferase [Enhygromyxa salina]|uniref:Methyltransferase n=1 Tax=Enhygromyxa salina TaxID=215803 RepID=A0A0C2D5J0_9BACT|nr:class I SAM-dependent methyltransferase [Enhygromyxa salina]KIG15307.1 methyltransferase [Enhygromyxa salina]
MKGKPIGQRNYEQFARRYAKYSKTKPHNAYYERPATLSLLPDVSGLHVLDAGCGPGFYTQELLRRGATVVGVDVTPAMIELTRALVGDRAELHVSDLAKPLYFAKDATFDLIIAPLMLDYIEEWTPVFAEFARVLRPGGRLVYSHSHPMSDYLVVKAKLDPDTRYFDCERYATEWGGFGKPRPTVVGYRRPLGQMLDPLVDAGFVLERLLEPLPTEELRRANPELHVILGQEPAFVCVRARKPEQVSRSDS